jgi:hypothetical protein
MRILTLVATAFVLAAPAATLKFDAPAGWVSKTPTSSMRVAEYALPKADGDPEDATLTVYFFGATQGGSVQANIDRWVGQMTQPDGRASKDVAKTSTVSSHGLTISVVDVTGTYTAEMTPGSADHFNKPNFRQCAAVVPTTGGPYFIKLTGPAKTVARWNDAFLTFLKSVRYE